MASRRTVPLASFEGGDPDGVPLMLLHGFPLDHTSWAPQLAADFGARVIAPDLRGFGASPFTEAASIEGMAEDVLALADRLGVGRFVLGGLSMGGYVALAVARRAPERLLGLVLADTRAEADAEETRRKRDEHVALVQAQGSQALADLVVPGFFTEAYRAAEPREVRAVRTTIAGQSPQGVVNALRAMRDRPDATQGLGSIACPSLVLVGEQDPLTPPQLAERLAEGIPGARLVVIPGAAHLSNLEQPEAFNEALGVFLRGLSRAPPEGGAEARPAWRQGG